MRRFFSAALVVTFAFALSGCNGVPLSTIWKLRNFQFANANVSKIRAAVRFPDWLTPTPEKARGEVHRATIEGESEAPQQAIHLQRARVAGDPAALAALSPNAENAVVVEVAPRDLLALRAVQEEAKRRVANGVKAGGKPGGITFKENIACRKTDMPTTGPILIDLWFHPDDEIGWVTVYERYDVGPMIEKAVKENPKAVDEALPPCEKRDARPEAAKDR